MKRLSLILPFVLLTAACQQPMNNSVATGAAAGAVIGAAINDDDRAEGAVVGAVVGGGATALVNRLSDGRTCVYRNTSTGAEYRAACP